MDSVGEHVLRDVARHVFGADTRVLSARHLAMGTGNIAYLVTVSGMDRQLVFRFNRGFRDDVYEAEAANYAQVAAATGVRVPDIISIDRTRTLAPTSYMVMEYIAGEEWTELCAPHNADVTPKEKREIRAAAGRFYADLHAVTRPATAEESLSYILLGLSQYAVAVDAGVFVVDLDKVAACERIVRGDTAVVSSQLSLCMFDGEIYFSRLDDRAPYALAFVCDLEWVAFGNRLADLTGQTLPGAKLVMLDEPANVTNELSLDAFYQAYEGKLPIDYAALGRLARYMQLSTWGIVSAEGAPEAKKQWIRESILPLINQLIDLVAAT